MGQLLAGFFKKQQPDLVSQTEEWFKYQDQVAFNSIAQAQKNLKDKEQERQRTIELKNLWHDTLVGNLMPTGQQRRNDIYQYGKVFIKLIAADGGETYDIAKAKLAKFWNSPFDYNDAIRYITGKDIRFFNSMRQ